MKRFTSVAALVLLGMALLFVDFFTKAYVYHLLPIATPSLHYPYGGIGVFENVLGVDFSIGLTINRGAAWGLFADFQLLLLIVRILVILAMICYVLFINTNRRAVLPFTLIIAGALGNVVDAFLYGYVIDFFRFNLWGYNFPVFNVADTCITLGVIWLFGVALLSKSPKKESTRA